MVAVGFEDFAVVGLGAEVLLGDAGEGVAELDGVFAEVLLGFGGWIGGGAGGWEVGWEVRGDARGFGRQLLVGFG